MPTKVTINVLLSEGYTQVQLFIVINYIHILIFKYKYNSSIPTSISEAYHINDGGGNTPSRLKRSGYGT